MGNSVSDFKEGNTWKFRDRVKTEIIDSRPSYTWNGTVMPKPSGPLYSGGSYNRVVDVSHPKFYWHRRRIELERKHRRDLYRRSRNSDIGDPFAKESVSVSVPSGGVLQSKVGARHGYSCFIFPSTTKQSAMRNLAAGIYPNIPTTLGMDKSVLWTYGSTAVKKSLPDIPEFSLFRFVGELREGLPKVPLATLAKERKLRNIGGEYLNYQFGIAPLLSDLQKFYEQLQNPKLRAAIDKHLDAEFRVRKVLENDRTITKRSMTFGEKAAAPAGGDGYIESITSRKIWSSCSFAYYQIKELDRLLRDLDNMTGGLGVMPTAIDLWNLIPWSWLIDWFTNFNHVVTNLSYLGRDGLYLRRGYIMGTFTTSEIHRRYGMTTYGLPIDTQGAITSERKYRVRASPFGFGYTWKDFSPFQLSILGALGVSRLRF
jgi:hypothetical protein